MRVAKYSILPVIAAFAAVFAFLPPTGGDATVRIIDQGDTWILAPGTAQIPVGGRLAIRNETSRTHTATCAKPDCWDSGDIQPGETVFIPVEQAGAYAFRCRYHPDAKGLSGRLVVGDAPTTDATPSPAAPSPSPEAS